MTAVSGDICNEVHLQIHKTEELQFIEITCNDNPCKNNATCVNREQRYVCQPRSTLRMSVYVRMVWSQLHRRYVIMRPYCRCAELDNYEEGDPPVGDDIPDERHEEGWEGENEEGWEGENEEGGEGENEEGWEGENEESWDGENEEGWEGENEEGWEGENEEGWEGENAQYGNVPFCAFSRKL